MRRMRFSIAGLMGVVVVAALGFAGLKAANEAWASGCFTLLVAALVLAVLTAVPARGKRRAYWAGFAIAGSAYGGIVFGSMLADPNATKPRLLTDLLFDRVEAAINPTSSFTYTVTLAMPPSKLAPVPLAIPVPPTALVSPPTMSRPYFLQVAHSLTGLLVGMLGGLYSAWLFGRGARREAETDLIPAHGPVDEPPPLST